MKELISRLPEVLHLLGLAEVVQLELPVDIGRVARKHFTGRVLVRVAVAGVLRSTKYIYGIDRTGTLARVFQVSCTSIEAVPQSPLPRVRAVPWLLGYLVVVF